MLSKPNSQMTFVAFPAEGTSQRGWIYAVWSESRYLVCHRDESGTSVGPPRLKMARGRVFGATKSTGIGEMIAGGKLIAKGRNQARNSVTKNKLIRQMTTIKRDQIEFTHSRPPPPPPLCQNARMLCFKGISRYSGCPAISYPPFLAGLHEGMRNLKAHLLRLLVAVFVSWVGAVIGDVPPFSRATTCSC